MASASESDVSSDCSDNGLEPLLNPAWHFTVVSAAFTLANVFAPYTLSAGGWLWGSVFWVYSTATTWWSGILIGRCVLDGRKRGVGSTYAEMMEDAFGTAGYVFTVVMQLGTYYMVCVALLVDAANWCLLSQQVLQDLSYVNGAGLCLWQWIFVCGAVIGVLGQIQTFRQIMPFAIASLASTLLRQFLMYYQIAHHDILAECEPHYGGVTSRSLVNSLSTTALLFGGHGLFPEEIGEMRKPESFFRALHVCYAIVISVYASNAYVAYYAWGNWVAGDIQFNWPLNEATFLSAILSIVWVLIEIAIANVMMMGLVEKVLKLEQPKFRSESTTCFCVCRSLWRSFFVLSQVLFSFMLSSAGIADLQALVGAFGFTALTYYAPFAAYWKLIASKRGEHFVWQASYCLAFLSGVAIMVVGTYISLTSIAKTLSTYNLFDTSTCTTSNILDLSSCSNPCRESYGYGNLSCSA